MFVLLGLFVMFEMFVWVLEVWVLCVPMLSGGGAEDSPELRGAFWLGGFAELETLGSGLGGPLEGVGERSPPPAGAPE